MEAHNTTLTILRLINIILITLSIGAWAVFYKRHKMIMALAPITWLMHVLIYGIYRFFVLETTLNSEFMHVWTALLIMHGVILLFISAIVSVPPINYFNDGED